MARQGTVFFVTIFFLALPLAGCLEDEVSEIKKIEAEELVEVDNPCSMPSESIIQSMITIQAHGVDRYFRLTVPSSEIGVKLPIVLAFHGGGGAEEEFPQQEEFDALAEEDKFIMAYVISEEGRTESEGEWFLNSAATSRDDNVFSEAIVDELSKSYCIDEDRLYAIGYSLGSMFTYEVACQLNTKFAAVASFAGTMPVSPETCNLYGSMGVMHIHGKLDLIIDYDDDWDWKDGEHEGVGTMSNIPGMIDYWADKSNCQDENSHNHLDVEHIVHSQCSSGVLVEHYGLEFGGHGWPEEVAGIETYQLMWQFLFQFTN